MVNFRNIELEPALERIATHALKDWAPETDIHVSSLGPGLSQAALLKVDIGGGAAGELGGVHVLKVVEGNGEPRQARSGEERVHAFAEEFANAHVPNVLRQWSGTVDEGVAGSALLIEIAGGSLLRYAAPTRERSEPLRMRVKQILDELAIAWTDLTDVRTSSAQDFIVEALGEAKAKEALEQAADFYGVTGYRGEHGHTFLSPSNLLSRPTDERFVAAFQHGDLHTGNLILPNEPDPEGDDFWLIDFERAGMSLFGLDFAYLELSILCDFYGELSAASLATCLHHAEDPRHRWPVPDDLGWLAEVMRASREAIWAFGETTAGRSDDLERQMVIARIAEALRWALRFRGRRKSKPALYYAGWYVSHLERLQGSAPGGTTVSVIKDVPAEQPLTGAGLEIWEGLWNEAGQFARRDWTYILIAERLGNGDELGAVGKLPFSAVVDLDPSSDNDGLFANAGPVMASARAVHVFSQGQPASDYKRGAGWLMSAGWRLRQEPPVDYLSWQRKRLRHIRLLFESIRQRTGDGHVFVLALAGQHDADDAAGDADRLLRVLETADEVWQGRSSLHVVSDAKMRPALPFTQHLIPASDFVRHLATVFGAEEAVIQYRVPSGEDGKMVAIEQGGLQTFREYFEVLHDRIASGGIEDERENDLFWRGGQILWSDLAEERDVPRDISEELNRALRDSLEGHRTRTVILQHRPGAGGTTAALRAAWEVHRDFPVAVLRPGHLVDREQIRFLADRLHRLFVLTERPVLLVADAADLPEANRERLYRELVARRARITLLYVRRSLFPDELGLVVTDPLAEDEAASFFARFRQLTDDPERIAELQKLSTPPSEQYRIPFFYGLITFEREFTKLRDYVGHYLRGVAGRARDVLAHLAFLTKYSNSGLELGLVQRLFRLESDDDRKLKIEDLLGPASALVVHRAGRYSVAHPLLAEEILAHLTESGDWRDNLKHIALEFIEDISALGDTGGDPVRTLLRQIFIDRSGTQEVDEGRGAFALVIEDLDALDYSVGHAVLKELTVVVPDEPHFWNHLGRHQIYRLRRDYDVAEKNLEQAILLSPKDALHHHTLGLARRARLTEGLRTARGQGVEANMSVIEANFERTVECFSESRALAPDDTYGYTTHVQTILGAADALQKAALVKSVARLPAGASDWAVEQMTIANTLLEDASKLYATLDHQDDYLQRCLAQINELYGDIDTVIELWERNHARGRSTPYSRRALAQAYLMRANRSWRALSPWELARIVELAGENLGRPTARDEDFRLWFEAHKLQPDFDVDEALGHLGLWSARSRTWRAPYYEYVLHGLLWLLERSDDPSRFEAAQEECVDLVPGRNDLSPVWLGKDPEKCPLVADSDLGEWDRRQRFWGDTSLLRRVNGVIDLINGPTSGHVLIGDSRVRAFFVPSFGGFMGNADENVPVNFYLGFSPAGLRAWDVERGHVPGALTRDGRPLEMPTFISRPRDTHYKEIQKDRVKNLRVSRVRDLARVFAEAALDRSGVVKLSWIEERVLATVGLSSSELVDQTRLRRMISVMDGVRIEEREGDLVAVGGAREVPGEEGNEQEVGFVAHYDRTDQDGFITGSEGDSLRFSADDLDPASPTEIKRNSVVRFLPSRDRRTERALEITLLPEATLFEGRIVPLGELRSLVEKEISRILEELSVKEERGGIDAQELEDQLRRTFRGARSLENRLGEKGLRDFLRTTEWLNVRGHKGAQMVTLADPLGRGQRSKPAIAKAQKAQTAPTAPQAATEDLRTAVREVYGRLWNRDKRVTVYSLGQELDRSLGSDGYARLVGSRGIRKPLEALGEWDLSRVNGQLLVLRRQGTPIGAGNGDGEVVRQGGGNGTDADIADLIRSAIQRIRSEHDELTLSVLGDALMGDLGEERYRELLGKNQLRSKIEDIGEWRIRVVGAGHVVVEPDRGESADPPEVR
jgi:tetratricopeptide (TPR) repeat protein